MAKSITCLSRNAHKFCQERSEISPGSTGNWYGHDEVWIRLTKKVLGDSSIWETSEKEPQYVSENLDWVQQLTETSIPMTSKAEFWLYKDRIFIEEHDEDYTFEQRKLLVREEFDKERRHFEKLHAKFSGASNENQSRSKISSEVRIFVWQRDGGRCASCGSNENLEYDHIIPFSKGGSNTERNIQLLCGNCNRLKSDNIQ
jgi:hypothetical protein